VNQWGQRIDDFLRARLDESYVSRMRNLGSMPTTPIANDKDRTSLFYTIHSINAHLEEFSREFSP
jgi:hypothetical protein